MGKRYKLHLVYDPSIQELYQRRLSTLLNTIPLSEEIDEEYENIKNAIHRIATEVLRTYKGGSKNKKHLIWYTEDIEKMTKEKNETYRKFLTQKTEETRQTYKTKNRELRKKIKEEKNLFWEQKCSQINTYIGGSRSTEVWQTIKNMKTNNREKNFPLIDLNTWAKYYESLLVETRGGFMDKGEKTKEDVEQEDYRLIDMEELKKNVYTLKNGRSPGPGDISAELLKYGGITLLNRLLNLLNLCLIKQKTPREWKICYISSIFKKGDKKDPNNYRGLSVTSTMSRVWGKIIQNMLRTEANVTISEDQSGFMPGRSCTDNLFILQQLIEKKINKNQEIHMTFIDLKKAYDNVPRNILMATLKTAGVSQYIRNIISELYDSNIAYVKQGEYLSEPIHTTKGLRQGCSLSPILFNIYVEIALTKWKTTVERMGIPTGDKHLFTLSFPDDQVVLAQDSYDMAFMLRRLHTEYENWGLAISLEKTEYLVANCDMNFDVLLGDDVKVKQVKEFKYLGAMVDTDGIGQREIQHRILNAKKVVGALNSIWWDKNINTTNKKRIGMTMVESVLTYGCEVWAMKEENKRKLTAVEMDYLRRSARVSRLDRVRNEEIRNRMKATETVVQRIEIKSLRWFGHLLRMEEDRWPKRIFKWNPPGRNKRGRPRKSWNNEIRRAMEERNLEEDTAYDRAAWKVGLGIQRPAV